MSQFLLSVDIFVSTKCDSIQNGIENWRPKAILPSSILSPSRAEINAVCLWTEIPFAFITALHILNTHTYTHTLARNLKADTDTRLIETCVCVCEKVCLPIRSWGTMWVVRMCMRHEHDGNPLHYVIRFGCFSLLLFCLTRTAIQTSLSEPLSLSVSLPLSPYRGSFVNGSARCATIVGARDRKGVRGLYADTCDT